MASTLEKIFDHVNGLKASKSDSPSISKMRSLIAQWACNSGVQKCVDQGLTNAILMRSAINPCVKFDFVPRKLNAFIFFNRIFKDVRGVSYCAAVRNGDQTNFNFYLEQLEKTEDDQDRVHLLGALGCASDVTVLAQCVLFAMCFYI